MRPNPKSSSSGNVPPKEPGSRRGKRPPWNVLLQPLGRGLRWIGSILAAPFRRAQRSDQVLAVLALLVWIAIILGFYFRGSYSFEGNLVVKEMSFTYTGAIEKLFLYSIDGIQNLDLQGSQPEPLVLTGTFSSDDATLNAKLSRLNKLTVELPYPTSQLIITPTAAAETSELSIQELRINPESQVNQLAYQPQLAQLSFCLQAIATPPEACLFPETLLNAPDQSASTLVGSLKLQLGQQPLTVSVGMVNLRELGIQTTVDDANELTFQFTPAIDELLLALPSPTRSLITLPKIADTGTTASDSSRWLRGDIDVTDVNFARFDITDNVTDELKTSTIVAGDVRIGNEVMQIQENQFLIVLSKPGIRKLRYIQLQTQSPASPQGLRTLISGESKGIAVGLYPDFPVQSIEPSWLSQFPNEAVNALLAFIAALTGVLLPRLFPEPAKNSDVPQK